MAGPPARRVRLLTHSAVPVEASVHRYRWTQRSKVSVQGYVRGNFANLGISKIVHPEYTPLPGAAVHVPFFPWMDELLQDDTSQTSEHGLARRVRTNRAHTMRYGCHGHRVRKKKELATTQFVGTLHGRPEDTTEHAHVTRQKLTDPLASQLHTSNSSLHSSWPRQATFDRIQLAFPPLPHHKSTTIPYQRMQSTRTRANARPITQQTNRMKPKQKRIFMLTRSHVWL